MILLDLEGLTEVEVAEVLGVPGGHGEVSPFASARHPPAPAPGLRAMTAQFACADIRLRLLDYQRGTLVADERRRPSPSGRVLGLRTRGCGRGDAQPRAGATPASASGTHRPQAAPGCLVGDRLGADSSSRAPPEGRGGHGGRRGRRPALLTTVALLDWAGPGSGSAPPLAEEAVNDHLRIMDPATLARGRQRRHPRGSALVRGAARLLADRAVPR